MSYKLTIDRGGQEQEIEMRTGQEIMADYNSRHPQPEATPGNTATGLLHAALRDDVAGWQAGMPLDLGGMRQALREAQFPKAR